MAEVVALRNNATPYPIYDAPWGVVFPILDADGDLVTGAAGLDSEVSLNGDTFADCTNEATEIGSSGMYYLLLTDAEMESDVVTVVVKTSTVGAKTTPMVFYPHKSVSIRSGTPQGGSTSSVTLDSSASAVDDLYTGMAALVNIDGVINMRIISSYDGSTKVATVIPDFSAAPDSDDFFNLLLTDGNQIQQANTTVLDGVNGAGNAAADALIARNIAGGSSTGRTVAQALAILRNKWAVSAGTLTVYATDDSTTSWTATVSSDAAAEPIIGNDPS